MVGLDCRHDYYLPMLLMHCLSEVAKNKESSSLPSQSHRREMHQCSLQVIDKCMACTFAWSCLTSDSIVSMLHAFCLRSNMEKMVQQIRFD